MERGEGGAGAIGGLGSEEREVFYRGLIPKTKDKWVVLRMISCEYRRNSGDLYDFKRIARILPV